jgi:hypothetical protein
MEIDFSHKNCTFKLQINFDRHNAGLKFIYCLRFDLPNFSLPSTFKDKKNHNRFNPFHHHSEICRRRLKHVRKDFTFTSFYISFTPHALLAKRLIGKVCVPLQNPLQNAKYFSHQRIRGLCRVSVLRNIWIK